MNIAISEIDYRIPEAAWFYFLDHVDVIYDYIKMDGTNHTCVLEEGGLSLLLNWMDNNYNIKHMYLFWDDVYKALSECLRRSKPLEWS